MIMLPVIALWAWVIMAAIICANSEQLERKIEHYAGENIALFFFLHYCSIFLFPLGHILSFVGDLCKKK